ncbi:MAG: uridine kinase [Kiritimatiellia bacterium]
MEGHVETIGELNEIVRRGDFPLLVDREESRHVRRIVRIAERIAAHVPAIRLVLLAGPSSAGKTTTAIRLCTRLKENGLTALRLSTDDYFVGDARNPRDANGNLDYEHVDAVDRERLVADLAALFAGAPVRLRRFDFERKDGYDDTVETTLAPLGVVVLEGIHALNPLLTAGIPEAIKFRVYLNIFTQPRAAPCVAFFAEDVRLLRRIVRDANYRNESASATLARWPSVEAGEQRWINPFRRLADAVFNSGLDYELAVLKPFARDLLCGLEAGDPNCREAERLSEILASVAEAPSDGIPGNSILRETIGGSQLAY